MNKRMMSKAFTLIELLVVIAIIALLLSIVMPALKRAKEFAKRTHCLANVKSLSLAYIMYLEDNEGKLPLGCGQVGVSITGAWCEMVESPYHYTPNSAPKELQFKAIRNGVLYPYLETVKVYRCPIAEKNEFRTYGISTAMNYPWFEHLGGDSGTLITKIYQVRNTSSRMLFLDDYGTDWNACWYVPATAEYWWNATPIRHGSGGNVFSFVDGHSEFHDWMDQRTIDLAEICAADPVNPSDARPYLHPESVQPDNEDLIWAAKAQWGEIKK